MDAGEERQHDHGENGAGGAEAGAPRAAGVDYRTLFEALPGLYLILLPDAPRFTIVAVTHAYVQATRADRGQMLGKGIFEIFPDNPDDLQASGTRNLRASLERVVTTRQPDAMAVQKYDIPLPPEEGGGFEERFWSPLNSPVRGADGSVDFIVHRVEDVTEFMRLSQSRDTEAKETEALRSRARRMEVEIIDRARQVQGANEKLREANDRLGELDRLKTEFFSNISHEFRTPLTLLLGPLETLLASCAQDDPARELLLQAHRNALRLLRLVNALLEFSRLEAGRHTARYMPTDLARYTTYLASAFSSAFDRAGLAFAIECEALPDAYYVDRGMWEKIVMNLLSNALKFCFEGRVDLVLRALPDGAACLTVRDTGTGIPAEELPHLFERFHRVSGARARSHEGSGIGLALARELVLLHGGTIEVSSQEGVGTEFTITLRPGHAHLPSAQVIADPAATPLSSGDAAAYAEEAMRWLPESQPLPAVNASDPGGHVLVVDDNRELREFISSLLLPHYEVSVAVDGEEALAAVARRQPDLVLSDVMMPRLDGLGLVQALRANPETATVPVILLSARAGQEASLDGFAAGADDYLAKPFTAQELLARVRTHLSMTRARETLNARLREANEELKAFSHTVSHDLRAPLMVIDGFSRALLKNHADQLDERARDHLVRIRSNVHKMDQLIGDLLAFSRAAAVPLRREPVDVSQMARVIADELRQTDPDRAADIVITEGMTADADVALLRVALGNLMSNAWKFSAHAVRPRIVVDRVTDGSATVFSVSDNGAGFDEAYADRLFQPFVRLHAEREFPGTGIGLATVRRVIERHEGWIRAQAAPGRGASFRFTLSPQKTPDV